MTNLSNYIFEALIATLLLNIIIQNIPEALPATLRNKNIVAIVPFHLRDGHVTTLLAALDVKIESFVLISHMLCIVMNREGFLNLTYAKMLKTINNEVSLGSLTIIIFSDELVQIVLELLHAMGWDDHL